MGNYPQKQVWCEPQAARSYDSPTVSQRKCFQSCTWEYGCIQKVCAHRHSAREEESGRT